MKKDREYYKTHPAEFFEEFHNIKLYDYQKEILNKMVSGKKYIINPFSDRYSKRIDIDTYKRFIEILFNKKVENRQ